MGALLTERLEDLWDDRPGNVRAQVTAALDRCCDRLMDYEIATHPNIDWMDTAIEDASVAIATLEHFRGRVQVLAAHESGLYWNSSTGTVSHTATASAVTPGGRETTEKPRSILPAAV